MSLAAKLTSSSSIRSYLCQKLSIRRCCSRRSCKLLFGPAWKRATLSGNSKSGRESYSKAVYVPLNPRKEIADRAFYAAPMLRHVEVATGIKHVGFAAWQGCQQLQIVKLPPSVISLEDGAFQGCYVLREITAPGCVQYSRRVFAECCSLSRVGIGKEADDANVLAPGAQLGRFAFESCLTLTSIAFAMDQTGKPRTLPDGTAFAVLALNAYVSQATFTASARGLVRKLQAIGRGQPHVHRHHSYPQLNVCTLRRFV